MMFLAEQKYKDTGNQDGVGRCENNISLWYYSENSIDRAILKEKDTLKKMDAAYIEITSLIDSVLAYPDLSIEERGTAYCVYGALYTLLDDTAQAKKYYQLAELLISDSMNLQKAGLLFSHRQTNLL